MQPTIALGRVIGSGRDHRSDEHGTNGHGGKLACRLGAAAVLEMLTFCREI